MGYYIYYNTAQWLWAIIFIKTLHRDNGLLYLLQHCTVTMGYYIYYNTAQWQWAIIFIITLHSDYGLLYLLKHCTETMGYYTYYNTFTIALHSVHGLSYFL